MRTDPGNAVNSQSGARRTFVALLPWMILCMLLGFLAAWNFRAQPTKVVETNSPNTVAAVKLPAQSPRAMEFSPATNPIRQIEELRPAHTNPVPEVYQLTRVNTADVTPAAYTQNGDASSVWGNLDMPSVIASPFSGLDPSPSDQSLAATQSSRSLAPTSEANNVLPLPTQPTEPLPTPLAATLAVPINAPGQNTQPTSGSFNNAPLPSDAVVSQGNLLTVTVRGAPLHSVLSLIAVQQGLSIAANSSLDMPVTVSLQPTSLENALDAVTSVSGCTWARIQDVIYVTPVKAQSPENFVIQGREIRVFDLNYASGTDLEKVVTGLLSPVGKVFVRQVDVKDKRKSAEQLVVEDMPAYVARICDYVAQADRAPRQVMVEARILQVKLTNDNRHGINFDALARISGADVHFKSLALATGLGPAGVITVDGTDFDTLLDCIINNGDTKTLASPKLLMINGQESKIQIGRRLGYFVATTTQTSTIQDVQFLEVGIVLTVTPLITEDGRVLMKVHPKVSNGDINTTTSLPEEETTEVDTAVLVNDGSGVIIGGLIQELDDARQTKIPFLGDMWLVGKLFQRNTVNRSRNEVIVALLPRIVPLDGCLTDEELNDIDRATTPLLTPTLERAGRPEPRLNSNRRDWVSGQFQP